MTRIEFLTVVQVLRKLDTLSDKTVHLGKVHLMSNNGRLWTPCSDGSNICPVRTSESTFNSRCEPVGRQFDRAYWQMWLYAMCHYSQTARDPKCKNQLAKAQNAAADECVVSDNGIPHPPARIQIHPDHASHQPSF
ncbi:hypothetical protein AJ79_02780 [Helicocarpus griseus UAMH5409]|uniref:Uncharacterized protein n=1 Tax=Helicocarpus griseus UAMH5409 TaxID=1447875 RepID=A0A2B7Y2I1_9EURO|nr:hypothetical protein AJ79_02780 [Helicocarpus griseus UAMH5409]